MQESDRERIRRIFKASARVFQKLDRVITNRNVTVTVRSSANDNGSHSIAYTTGDCITMVDQSKATKDHSGVFLTNEQLIPILKGINLHELGHVLWTPRVDSHWWKSLINLEPQFDWAREVLWNQFEDGRVESMIYSLFPPAKRYLTLVALHVIADGSPSSDPVHTTLRYILLRVRKNIPAQILARYRDELAWSLQSRNYSDPYKRINVLDSLIDQYLVTDPNSKHYASIEILQYAAIWMNDHCGAYRHDNMKPSSKSTCGHSSGSSGTPVSGSSNDTPPEANKKLAQKAIDKMNQPKPQTEEDELFDEIVSDVFGEGEPFGGDEDDTDADEDGKSVGDSADEGEGDDDTDSATGSDDSTADGDDSSEGGNAAGTGTAPDSNIGGTHRDIQELLKQIEVEAEDLFGEAIETVIGEAYGSGHGKSVSEVRRFDMKPVDSPLRIMERHMERELQRLRTGLDAEWQRRQAVGKFSSRAWVTRQSQADLNVFDRFDSGGEEAASLELAVAVDLSGSMHNQPAMAASQYLWAITRAALSFDMVNVTSFAFDETHYQMYGGKIQPLPNKYHSWGAGGGTNPTSALLDVRDIFTTTVRPNKALIILTDGAWNATTEADRIITSLNNMGVITCLFGLNYHGLNHNCLIHEAVTSPDVIVKMFRQLVNATAQRARQRVG